MSDIPNIGPTGRSRFNERLQKEEAEYNVGIAISNDMVHFHFGVRASGFAIGVNEAEALAKAILDAAQTIRNQQQ